MFDLWSGNTVHRNVHPSSVSLVACWIPCSIRCRSIGCLWTKRICCRSAYHRCSCFCSVVVRLMKTSNPSGWSYSWREVPLLLCWSPFTRRMSPEVLFRHIHKGSFTGQPLKILNQQKILDYKSIPFNKNWFVIQNLLSKYWKTVDDNRAWSMQGSRSPSKAIMRDDFLQAMYLRLDSCPVQAAADMHFCAAQGRDHSKCCRNNGVTSTLAGDKCLVFCDQVCSDILS